MTEEVAKQSATKLPEKLSPKAERLVTALQKVNDVDQLAKYGLQPQGKISVAAEKATKAVSGREVGEVGDQLGQLMVALKTPVADDGHSKGLLAKFFHKAKKEVLTVKAGYENVNVTINSISQVLQDSSDKLANDNEVLHQLFTDNQHYYAELNDYINAGLVRIHELDTQVIPEKVKAVDSAEGTDQQLKAQELSQLQAFRDRLSQRVYSLQLSQQLALQQIAQVNLIARNNNMIRDKITDALTNSVPMWKSQAATRLALINQQRANESIKLSSETSKELVKANAQAIHDATLDVAQQSQEAFIDEDTLKETQDSLVSTIQGYQQIIAEGQKKRDGATARLQAQTQKMRDQITKASRREIDAEISDLTQKRLKANNDDPFAEVENDDE